MVKPTNGHACSACGVKLTEETAPPSVVRRGSGYCRSCGNARASRNSKARRAAVREARPIGCSWCASVFIQSTLKQRFCRPECKDAYKAELGKARRWIAKLGRRCEECNGPVCVSRISRSKFCSVACKQRAHNRMNAGERRAAQRAATVAPVDRAAIYNRDGGRCQLRLKCSGKSVLKPGEWHLDHIIPLSDAENSAHAPWNVHVSCAACNLSKGNRPVGEQLLLVG